MIFRRMLTPFTKLIKGFLFLMGLSASELNTSSLYFDGVYLTTELRGVKTELHGVLHWSRNIPDNFDVQSLNEEIKGIIMQTMMLCVN
jgi:hypothetical protein